MSTRLRSNPTPGLEAELLGPTYRLSVDQFQQMKREKVFDEPDRVEFRDGFLRGNDPASDSEFYRLSVQQYRRMADAAILTRDDRVELLEGWLVSKMTKNPPHEIAKGLTQDRLIPLTPPGWFVVIEGPTNTSNSEPEPDLMIVRGSRRDYFNQAPGPRDVALVVEIADSSLARDQTIKKRLYAQGGFPTYWLINLTNSRIEIYSDPTREVSYRNRQDYGPDDLIPLIIEGLEVGRLIVRDLLP